MYMMNLMLSKVGYEIKLVWYKQFVVVNFLGALFPQIH